MSSAVQTRLLRTMGRAVADFKMIDDGDRIMVAVSGGKDSYAMLHLLRDVQKRAPVKFTLKVVNIDQGHPGYPAERLQSYMDREGYDFTMIKEDTYSIVTDKISEGKTYCSLCSRLRRGILYNAAETYGCNKIALGHHRDDILQTLLLNIFFSGRLAAMPPKLYSNDGRNIVIRPLAYCDEAEIRAFAEEQGFPILPCDLCGSQENLQRKIVANMINDLEAKHPGLKQVMLSSLSNVRPTHLLDRSLLSQLGLDLPREGEENEGRMIPAADLLRVRAST